MHRLLALLLLLSKVGAQTTLEETIVIAERLLAEADASFTQDDLARRAPLTIDQLLLTDPSFSLYRAQDATFANPTAAGVSLRRTGATATSRTLILRDGIPQNDPFGGWISWARYSPSLLDSVRILPAAQATAWGNQSAAGVIHLRSRQPDDSLHVMQGTYGSRGTYGFSSSNDFVSEDGSAALQASVFALGTDGHHPLDASQRGVIDRPLSLEATGADLRSVWKPSGNFTLDSSISFFEEERGNGTVLNRNATEALDLSLRATWELATMTNQATVYFQRRDFEAAFSSAADERNIEAIALDQFDVPATGVGGSYSSRLSLSDERNLTLGMDARHLDGETNERVAFDGRIRTAGGEQTFLGLFTQLETPLPHELKLSASARIDYYRNSSGSLREVRTDGTLRTSEDYPARDSWEPSFGLTLSRQVSDTLHFSAAVSTAFRAPTLNELYRPFRVRDDQTNANPALDPERFYSGELTAILTPTESLEWRNTLFAHLINDAIANVPLGANLAQRQNVEEARVWGIESRLNYQPCEEISATLAYQFTETEFSESRTQPLLENAPFPLSPQHRLTAAISLQATSRLTLEASTAFSSASYDDALATRRLESYWTSGISAGYEVSENLTLIGRIDNLFDVRIPTALDSSFLSSYGAPRTALLTARYRW